MYLWRYICIFVEPFHCGGTIWRAVCAQECSANCKPVADIVFMHLLPLLRLVQKRPNWGIKHNKSQNSRANFSGERCGIVHCASPNVCLHFKKGTLWDGSPACLVGYVQIISGNYILSSLSVSAQPPQHVFKLFLHFFSQPYTLCSIIVIELSKCLKYLSVNK